MANMNNDIALVDMDDTLCNYAKAIIESLDKLWSDDEPQIYPFHGGRNPDYLQARIQLIRAQPGWWRDLEPLTLGFDILDLLRKYGFSINILTKGPRTNPNAWTEKVEWVQKYVSDALTTITQDKSLVYGKILVDDYPSYIRGWLKHRPRGLAIMPDQPWNHDFGHPNVIRATKENLAQVELLIVRQLQRDK